MSNSSSSSSACDLAPFNPSNPEYYLKSKIRIQDLAYDNFKIKYCAEPLKRFVDYRDLKVGDIVVRTNVHYFGDCQRISCLEYDFTRVVKISACFITWACCDPMGNIVEEEPVHHPSNRRSGRFKIHDWGQPVPVLVASPTMT
jgi:hypothetical protein